jgi:hypothetical protein
MKNKIDKQKTKRIMVYFICHEREKKGKNNNGLVTIRPP